MKLLSFFLTFLNMLNRVPLQFDLQFRLPVSRNPALYYGYACEKQSARQPNMLRNGSADSFRDLTGSVQLFLAENQNFLTAPAAHLTVSPDLILNDPGNFRITITHSDRRLYYGKQNGKNRVVSPFDAP